MRLLYLIFVRLCGWLVLLGPPVSAEIAGLIERLATDNDGWGYQRIQSEPLKLGRRASYRT